MKRFKSYGFWTALSGAVVIFLNALGDCFGFSIDNELVSGLIMAFAGVLVVLGVVSMPKNDETKSEDETGEESNENPLNEQEGVNTNEEENSIDAQENGAKEENSLAEQDNNADEEVSSNGKSSVSDLEDKE